LENDELVVGEVYFSTHLGQYLYLGKEDDRLRVRFASGIEDTLEAKTHEQSVRDWAFELASFGSSAPNPEPRRKFVRSVGFVAQSADLHTELLPSYVPAFKARYEELTGLPVSEETPGFHVLQSDSDLWASALHVDFTGTVFSMNQIYFGLNIQIGRREMGHYYISNNMVFYQLLRWGFVLGPKQDPDRIRERLPDDLKEHLDRGLRIK
jgi:hypothetical protein